MTTFVILRDRFADQVAIELRGAATGETIRVAALTFAQRLPLEDGERVKVGVVEARDAGVARLKQHNDVIWHYWYTVDGIFEPVKNMTEVNRQQNLHDRQAGDAIKEIVARITDYIHAYKARFDCNVADDGVLGPLVEDMLKAAIGLLNGPTGDIDCGAMDRKIRDIGTEGGYDRDEL